MAKTKIHVGLEIGTSKTCMVVGEVKPDATVTIIGVGEVPSEGVVRGEIEGTSKVIQCIYDAWNMAQDHADVDIMTVYLSVTGAHIVENEAKALNVDKLTALVKKEGITYDEKGEVMEYLQSVINKEWVAFEKEDPVIKQKMEEVLHGL